MSGGGQHVRPELEVPCPECGAPAGRRCKTRTGKKRKEGVHSERHQRAMREVSEETRRAHRRWLGIDEEQ
jgi:hypothetical protein